MTIFNHKKLINTSVVAYIFIQKSTVKQIDQTDIYAKGLRSCL